MAGPMGKFEYISDDTNTYIVKEDTSNANATSSHVASTARVNLPHGYQVRHIWAQDNHDVTGGRTPTFDRRKITINDPTDGLWVGTTANITLPDFSVTPSVAVAWGVISFVGERRLNR